jgi:hypothetical protein
MPILKLYQLPTPTSATQVTSTKATYVKQAVISNSGANATAIGDSTLTTAATGVNIPANTNYSLGPVSGEAAFDLSELYVIAATGNVNVLVLLR